MKIKQRPEDFQVEEIHDVSPAEEGDYAFYRLEKQEWATFDAIQAVRRRWHVNRRDLSYGGLKDRHARTMQYLTILHGPRRDLEHDKVTLKYIGQLARPYTSKDIQTNQFRITLRSLKSDEMGRAQKALAEIRLDGVPNYFDDQRFGSVGANGAFVARHMVLGNFEDALKLALANPYTHDRGSQKEEKAVLREHWGDWRKCQALLPRGQNQRLIDYLIQHPTDFRGALARLRPELNSLYLAAYQSYLWNRMVAQYLRQLCRPEQIVPVRTRLGELPMHRNLDESQRAELAQLVLPLPSARLKIEPSDWKAALIDQVLADEGFTLGAMKVKGLREPFFSKGERPGLLMPANFQFEFSADELQRGRQKLGLAFQLPRASYATIVVKRVSP